MTRINSIILLTLIIAISFAATDTSDYTVGSAALIKGDIKTAKIRLTAAYKKNSEDPFVQMAYARIAPCSTAVQLYKRIGETRSAPDSLRAAAFKQLGDYYYALSDFPEAIDNYRYASKHGNMAIYKHSWALCSYASGDTVSAKSLWHTLTLEYGDTIAEIANYHLGLILTKQKSWQEAIVCFDKTGQPSVSKPWAVAALNEKLECTKKLGLSDKVVMLEKQLDPWRDLLLENLNAESSLSGSSTLSSMNAGQASSKTMSESENIDSGKLYALQIGAFGSKENAIVLEKKLKKDFRDVTTQEFSIEDKLFYRVRVGSFTSKDAAASFGNNSLAKKGFSFRVVDKNE